MPPIQYVPLASWVLIERMDEAAEMAGDIVIPEIAQTKSNKGRVVACGEGRIVGDKLVPMDLAEGDLVLFSKYGAEEVKLDGKDYLLLRYDEIKLKQRRIFG